MFPTITAWQAERLIKVLPDIIRCLRKKTEDRLDINCVGYWILLLIRYTHCLKGRVLKSSRGAGILYLIQMTIASTTC